MFSPTRSSVAGTFEYGDSSGTAVSRIPDHRHVLAANRLSKLTRGYAGLLPAYKDCGDCVYVCSHCSALFWYQERVIRASRVGAPVYHQCCKSGAVVLPYPFQPPPLLVALFKIPGFMENIRAYNMMFAMTSFGAKIDNGINNGRGPYIFKISGQIAHWIGSLCPEPQHRPRFLQLYFYDTQNEVSNRLSFYCDEPRNPLSADVVSQLIDVLNDCNGYVKIFRTARDMSANRELEEFSVRLYHNVSDSRYGPPVSGTLGAIAYADDPNASQYDIIVHSRSGHPHRISKLHHSYMPLQYPLLFPFAEDGWSTQLRLRSGDGARIRPLTVNMFYSYQIHERKNVFSLILRGGRLFQQYLVDAYVCIEQNRLDYINQNQSDLRSEVVTGVYDALSKGDSEGKSIGKRIILPSSFVGGPRYMYSHYQDAMAICRVYGNPQYFVTFTCNVNWPEITRYMKMYSVKHSEDRPDIIARVFQMKIQEFISFIKEDRPFGDVVAYLYTVEFQKRGLPHCHSLIWVTSTSKIRDPSDVDNFISAELPDPFLEPTLYDVITKYMIHGPCGLLNPRSPCMRDGCCRKSFPKPFKEATIFDKDGYVHYKRGNVVTHTMSNGIRVHNGFVVPYNKRLATRFQAHINVEYCGWNMMIKYLFKYISKGVERVSFAIQQSEQYGTRNDTNKEVSVDEIASFLDGRFICPHEAAWRIFNFPIHERRPPVQILVVHLENMQPTTFTDKSKLHSVIRNPSFGRTTLTEWLFNNRRDTSGRHLTYINYPSEFRWDASSKDWIRRSRSGPTMIGRLANIHPTAGELFYLRMLLSHQKGCTSFADIRTIGQTRYASFQLTCEAMGLIGDDKEWLFAFNEASEWATSPQLRVLFCHLLLFCDVTNPLLLWEDGWRRMSDDLVYMISSSLKGRSITIDDAFIQQQVLLEIEKILNSATPSKSVSDFGLPHLSKATLATLTNRLLLEETCYDRVLLQNQHADMVQQLNPDQLHVYNQVVTAVSQKKQVLIFVYGYGGTGKTFLWSTIITFLRSIGNIVLAVAGSGIASLLLPSGRTAHSRFNIPIDITDKSICNIRKRTQLAELLLKTSFVIWDEATMTDRKCFECVDRTFRDILDHPDLPFGGMSILLGGDFRQTLPVIQKASDAEIIASTLPYSPIWSYFTVCRLQYNMRLAVMSDEDARLATWLLQIGNGTVGDVVSSISRNTYVVQLPETLLIQPSTDPLQDLINFVYEPHMLQKPTEKDLSERAIVCPKNDTTDEINSRVLMLTTSSSKTYYSSDSVLPHGERSSNFDIMYPQEYLNQLNFSGLPVHALLLKVNTPVLLLRNINQRLGLCNGTRLIITQLLPTVIEASIMTGTAVGNRVYIPKIKFIHNNPDLPFTFIRKQFPLKVCYAMTINKSQGQTLKKVGIYLPQPVFAHGQLYVALSRATSAISIKVLIVDDAGNTSKTTNNVVFKDLLRHLDVDEL